MNCPKCGRENPDGAQKCSSCGWALTTNSTSDTTLVPRRSKIAVVSFVLGIVGAAFTVRVAGILTLLFFLIITISAIIFGIVGIAKISKSGGRLKGKGFAIAGIVIPVVYLSILLTVGFILRQRRATYWRQQRQFVTIDLALMVFRNDYGYYPPSDGMDVDNRHYCGAMKLCEAMLGQDLRGFHPDSQFKQDGIDNSGNSLYVPATLDARRGPYLGPPNANVYRLRDVFKDVGPFDREKYVLCDFYIKRRHSGKKTGMPILYYKANNSNKTMDSSEPMNKRIYNAEDNLTLIRLGKVENGKHHLLEKDNGEFFYDKSYKIIDPKVPGRAWPYRADSFILISAGRDGLYGTTDDMVNFNN